MTQCQFKMRRMGGLTGYYEQCTRSGRYIEVTVPEGVPVSVCGTHQKMLAKRAALKIPAPLGWFVQTKPQAR